jgi:hypothetical protein
LFDFLGREGQGAFHDLIESFIELSSKALPGNLYSVFIVPRDFDYETNSVPIHIPFLESKLEEQIDKFIKAAIGHPYRGCMTCKDMPNGECIDIPKLLYPLFAFGRPLSKFQWEFVTEVSRAPEDALEYLVQNHIAYPLIHRGIALSKIGEQRAQTVSFDIKGGEGIDVIPNSLRIMDFQEPSMMTRTDSSLNMLFEQKPTPTSLIRMLACVMGVGGNGEKWLDELWHYLSSPDICSAPSALVANQFYTKVVIDYLAQALLSPKYGFTDRHFRIFEATSSLYADYLASKPQRVYSDISNASGVLYNIGYVFDRIKNRHKAHFFSGNTKKVSDSAALYLLSEAKPESLFLQLEQIYLQGLYLYNIGMFNDSAKTFKKGLEACLKAKDSIVEKMEHFEIVGMDLVPTFISNYIKSKQMLVHSEKMDELSQIGQLPHTLLEKTGVSYSSDIIEPMKKIKIGEDWVGYSDAWNPSGGAVSFNLVGHEGMIADTLAAAGQIFQRLGESIRVYTPQHFKEYISTAQNCTGTLIVIGGAESRFGLGNFICEVDPTIAHLFQLVTSGPMGVPLQAFKYNKPIVILATWSIGDSTRALNRWLKEYTMENEFGTIVDMVIQNPLMRSFASRMGSNITEKMADSLTNHISLRLKNLGRLLSKSENEELNQEIKEFVQPEKQDSQSQQKAAVSSFLKNTAPDKARAFVEVMSNSMWIDVVEESLSTLRSPVVELDQLEEIISILVPIGMDAVEEGQKKNTRRDTARFNEFQKTFREYAFRVEKLQLSLEARGTVEHGEWAEVTSDIFNTVSAFMRLLKSGGPA